VLNVVIAPMPTESDFRLVIFIWSIITCVLCTFL